MSPAVKKGLSGESGREQPLFESGCSLAGTALPGMKAD
jgi:hypothetical protein